MKNGKNGKKRGNPANPSQIVFEQMAEDYERLLSAKGDPYVSQPQIIEALTNVKIPLSEAAIRGAVRRLRDMYYKTEAQIQEIMRPRTDQFVKNNPKYVTNSVPAIVGGILKENEGKMWRKILTERCGVTKSLMASTENIEAAIKSGFATAEQIEAGIRCLARRGQNPEVLRKKFVHQG